MGSSAAARLASCQRRGAEFLFAASVMLRLINAGVFACCQAPSADSETIRPRLHLSRLCGPEIHPRATVSVAFWKMSCSAREPRSGSIVGSQNRSTMRSMRSIAGSASFFASSTPLVSHARSPQTSVHTTFTRPRRVRIVARSRRSCLSKTMDEIRDMFVAPFSEWLPRWLVVLEARESRRLGPSPVMSDGPASLR